MYFNEAKHSRKSTETTLTNVDYIVCVLSNPKVTRTYTEIRARLFEWRKKFIGLNINRDFRSKGNLISYFQTEDGYVAIDKKGTKRGECWTKDPIKRLKGLWYKKQPRQYALTTKGKERLEKLKNLGYTF